MFKWIGGVKDALFGASEVIDEPSHEERVKEANFVEEDRVACLFGKVLEDLEKDYIEWSVSSDNFRYRYENENNKIGFTYYNEYYGDNSIGGFTHSGTLSMGKVTFKVNHDSCVKFKKLWADVTAKKVQDEKDSIFKQWGCK